MTINSAAKTATAARRDLEILNDLIPWATLSYEEREIMNEGLQRIYDIMRENEEKIGV